MNNTHKSGAGRKPLKPDYDAVASGRSPESSGRYLGRNLHIRNVLPVRPDRCARRSEGEDEAPEAKYW